MCIGDANDSKRFFSSFNLTSTTIDILSFLHTRLARDDGSSLKNERERESEEMIAS